jgi:hypothetical protein
MHIMAEIVTYSCAVLFGVLFLFELDKPLAARYVWHLQNKANIAGFGAQFEAEMKSAMDRSRYYMISGPRSLAMSSTDVVHFAKRTYACLERSKLHSREQTFATP